MPRPHRVLLLTAEAVLLAVGLTLLGIYVHRTIWDIDLFWHIAAGRAIVGAGAIPTTDIFSAIDPERTWVTFQWGYEVLVYLLDQGGGLERVRLVHALVMGASILLVWVGLRFRLRLGPWVSLAVVALFLVLFGDRIRVRPHVFNVLAWSLLFPWLVRGPASLGRLAWLTMGLVVAVWANLHAGGVFLFLLAAATLPAGAVGARLLRLPDRERPGVVRPIGWFLCGLVPALLAPNFVRGNIQALTMLEGTEQAIGEWLPSWHYLELAGQTGAAGPAHLLCGLAPLALGLAWLLVTARALRRGREGLSEAGVWRLLFVLSMIVLSLRSVRFVYASVFGWLALAPLLGAWLRGVRPSLATATWPRVVAAAAALVLGFVSYRFNVTSQHGDFETAVARARSEEPIDTRRFPTEQAVFLEMTGFEGHVFCQANWGGYLLYQLWPKVRVTADGRGNYPKSVTDDLAYVYDRANQAPTSSVAAVAEIYERYPIDAVVHQRPEWPMGQQPDPNTWVRVFADRKGGIWVRNTPRGRAYLERLRSMGGG